jgi:hypothetical protein
MKKGQILLEFRFGELTVAIAFVIATSISVIVNGLVSHWGNSYKYVFSFCPGCLYVFAFVISTSVILMPKMKEPSLTNYHLIFLSFGFGIFSYITAEALLNKFTDSLYTPAFHQLFFGFYVFWFENLYVVFNEVL